MTFPFAITPDIREAYQAHQDYISAGQRWLLRNDPDGQNEQVLLEEIITQIEHAAAAHFGDDEDAYWQFHDAVGLDQMSSGDWYDTVAAEQEPA
jgi:hypothetical protein